MLKRESIRSEPVVKNRRDWAMASKIDPCDCILARRGELSQRAMWRLAKVKFPGIRLMARDYDHCGCILARRGGRFGARGEDRGGM